MRYLSADFIYPLSDAENILPLIQGSIVLDGEDKIIETLSYRLDHSDLEIYSGALVPGFINSHTHLELSHLKGRIPEGMGLIDFILTLQKIREEDPNKIQEEIKSALIFMKDSGIMGFGDISNTMDSFQLKRDSPLVSHTFLECFGFIPSRAPMVIEKALDLKGKAEDLGLKNSIVPHSPYSVSKELFDLIRKEDPGIMSIHNQETEAENEFYEEAKGDFLRLYQSFGMDISFFKAYHSNSLQTYYPWLGPRKKILVHNTFTNPNDLEIIGPKDYLCFCPKANLYIEKALPKVPEFLKYSSRLLIGTDSLASNDQLSILEELKVLQFHFPEIPLGQMLFWASKNGAEFFEWKDLGSFEKGKKPGLVLIENLDANGNLKPNSIAKRMV